MANAANNADNSAANNAAKSVTNDAANEAANQVIIFRKKIAGLGPSTLERFVLRARKAIDLRDPVNVLVTSSRELRSLNRQFRGMDKATDVLSFPSAPAVAVRAKRFAGDLAISADIARQNALRLGHSVAAEIKILTLHGVLHLAGFDHENDRGEMARTESRLRRQLKLEPGLIERMPQPDHVASARGNRKGSSKGRRRRG